MPYGRLARDAIKISLRRLIYIEQGLLDPRGSVSIRSIGVRPDSVFQKRKREDLRPQQRREAIAISPEEEEREDGDDAGHPETARIKKDVIEHDVHDHRDEQGEPERNEAPDEQKQTADDLNAGDGVNVAAAKERADELAG